MFKVDRFGRYVDSLLVDPSNEDDDDDDEWDERDNDDAELSP